MQCNYGKQFIRSIPQSSLEHHDSQEPVCPDNFKISMFFHMQKTLFKLNRKTSIWFRLISPLISLFYCFSNYYHQQHRLSFLTIYLHPRTSNFYTYPKAAGHDLSIFNLIYFQIGLFTWLINLHKCYRIIEGNQFSGPIPTDIGNLINLEKL